MTDLRSESHLVRPIEVIMPLSNDLLYRDDNMLENMFLNLFNCNEKLTIV